MLMKTDTELLEQLEILDLIDGPSLERLSYLLRHQELWPKGFSWHYSDCDRCAIGLTVAFWKLNPNDVYVYTYDIARKALKMNMANFDPIFYQPYLKEGGLVTYAVSPEMVADKIDAHLEEKHFVV